MLGLLLLSRNSSGENGEKLQLRCSTRGKLGMRLFRRDKPTAPFPGLGSVPTGAARGNVGSVSPENTNVGLAGGGGAALGSAGVRSSEFSGNVDLGDLPELQEGGTGFQSRLQLLLHLSGHSSTGINP